MTDKKNNHAEDSSEVYGKEIGHLKWPFIIVLLFILLLIILIDIYYRSL